jgi:UDP-N-acetylmuramyl pentapeptide phosphotransferase/UDP-N-acetylglucosamine-1-phosphate transferase
MIMETHLYSTVVAFLLAGVITLAMTPTVIKVVLRKGLMDEPDGGRKVHTKRIPTLGGIGIFIGFFFACNLIGEFYGYAMDNLFRLSLVLLLLVGVKDDLIQIAARHKLWFQIAAGVMAMWGSESVITNFGGVFGIHDIPVWVGVLVTLFTFVVVINAYNLIDGADGLAGGLGVVMSGILGTAFLLNGEYALSLLSFSLAGALIGYLYFNFYPAKIFMGDTGSLVVGYTLAYLAVLFVDRVTPNPAYAINAYAPVLIVALLIVPLYDTMRVFTLRLRKGISPFMPGKEHIHHVLMGYGFVHHTLSIYLYMANVAIFSVALGLGLLGININLVLIGTLLTAGFVLPSRSRLVILFAILGIEHPDPLKEYLLEKQRESLLESQPIRGSAEIGI